MVYPERARCPVIFIDSNIPMYLVGRDHPNKHRAAEVLRQLVRAEEHW